MPREGEAGASRGMFAGFGFGRGPMSSFFGWRDPFDDPFFTRPFGSMHDTNSSFDSPAPAAPTTAYKRPIIKQLNSDGEEEEEEEEDVREEADKKSNDVTLSNDHQTMDEKENPQIANKSESFSYRKVTYGGVDGAYRTSTVSRRTTSDGVVLEESKAADKTTGQAEHRISRVIQNKGHSVTRMLKPDGKVETMQSLHNLQEDEVAGFEKNWKGNASRLLGQRNNKEDLKKDYFPGAGIRGRWKSSSSLKWGDRALPVVATSRADEGAAASSSASTVKKVVRIPIE